MTPECLLAINQIVRGAVVSATPLDFEARILLAAKNDGLSGVKQSTVKQVAVLFGAFAPLGDPCLEVLLKGTRPFGNGQAPGRGTLLLGYHWARY